MVGAYVGDDAEVGGDDVGAVEPSAESYLYNSYIYVLLGKVGECHRCGEFKERGLQRLEEGSLLFYKIHYELLACRRAVHSDSFAEVYQMGRCV